MFRLNHLILIVCLGIIPMVLPAQVQSNLRQKTLAITGDTLALDSLSVDASSVQLSANGIPLSHSSYRVEPAHGLVIWLKGKKPRTDSIRVSYRTLPINFGKTYMHKDIKDIEPDDAGHINPFSITADNQSESFANMKGLEKRGSISRGISFGNSQDLSVNSNLDLQLSGRVSDKVSILAAISDDNIPVQPEGNTQQLQDFDQVYIQLFDDRSALRAGDFVLKRPKSYFMNYYKRAQGLSFSSKFKTTKAPGEKNKPPSMLVQASAAVSKGKFARNTIQGIEGNQGPYRLKGAENESFIIILSGTERVFIDGKLLLRGQENDYVIDYNTAEVTFTARQLITKDKRIIVEFQYSDKNYARSLFQFSDDYVGKRMRLIFNLYAEQDAKNQPLQLELSDEQKALLAAVGDSLDDAITRSIDSVEFTNDKVLYKMLDSLGYDSVFVYSTNPDSAHYRLSFSLVGQGKGDYIQVKSTANGRVYLWVAPDTLGNQVIRQGSYEPVTKLITPKKRQMITLGGDCHLSKHTTVQFEGALSNQDINTFSNKDAADNIGHALKVGIRNKQNISSEQENPWQFLSSAGYEQVHKNFSYIEWFRPAEFDRDWNISNAGLKEMQHLPYAGIALMKKDVGRFAYDFNSLISEEGEYNGYRNSLTALLSTPGWQIHATGSLLRTDGSAYTTEFIRNKSRVARRMRYFTLGIRDEYEKNRFRLPGTDSLSANSYEFLEWEVFISNPDTVRNNYMLSYQERTDYAPGGNGLAEATFARNISFSADIVKNPSSTLRNKTTYRILQIKNSGITNQKPDSSLLSRLEYNLKLLKGTLISSSFYEIGTGMEQKKEFAYIEVAAGQGVYSWTDYNDNGIKELDEFEVAAFQDQASFIRVFTPTNSYVKTFSNQFSQMIFLRPEIAWHDKKGWRKLISRFSNQASFRVDRKTNREGLAERFDPFRTSIADTSLISLNSSFRNTFYFNKTSPVFGIDLNYQDVRNKVLLTNGFDSRSHLFREVRLRWNISRAFLLNAEYTEGEKTSGSEYFSSRNYSIDYWKAEPKISFQPGTTFRVSLLGAYTEKTNALTSVSADSSTGGELGVHRNIGAELRFTSVGKGSLLINANYIQISFSNPDGSDATGNTSLAFEMLEGLQPGQNATWSVSWQRSLANNLQLNLNYNGRVSEGNKAIHAGGVQLRAYF